MKIVTKSNYCPRFSAKFERAQQKPRMFFFSNIFLTNIHLPNEKEQKAESNFGAYSQMTAELKFIEIKTREWHDINDLKF